MEEFRDMKNGKASRPSEVRAEFILSNGDIGFRVLMKLCQRILDGKGMPDDWATSDCDSYF